MFFGSFFLGGGEGSLGEDGVCGFVVVVFEVGVGSEGELVAGGGGVGGVWWCVVLVWEVFYGVVCVFLCGFVCFEDEDEGVWEEFVEVFWVCLFGCGVVVVFCGSNDWGGR